MKNLLLLSILVTLTVSVLAQKSNIPSDYKLVYVQDFNSPQAFNEFDMTDEEAWKINQQDDNKTLELFGKSDYQARVRSPFNIALVKNVLVGDFILEVNLAQTGEEYDHRDLCLFFNVKDPNNFYYVHLATKADDHANNIFLVNDEPRVKIGTKTSEGTKWGESNSWHTVRIERNSSSGLIRIYFDDMNNPVMEAQDTHFENGRIGVGSFDDTGQFDNIKIWAPELKPGEDEFFKSSNTNLKKEKE